VTPLDTVVQFLDTTLRSRDLPDYDAAVNGLQLSNGGTVSRIAAAVDFSAETVSAALADGADLLVVHHGMFWRGARPFVGPAYERLRDCIRSNLAVYSSHIPLDLHPQLGNNVLLSRALDLTSDGAFGRFRDVEIGVTGIADVPTSVIVERATAFAATLATTAVATRFPAHRRTHRWAVVTGAGASPSMLAEALERNVDTLIVGEGTHHSAVDAIEQGLVIVYAGHYATETLGVRAVAERVAKTFGLTSTFIAAPTGL
jgi:dinuclear metal center YbgI/SA1388 family protein